MVVADNLIELNNGASSNSNDSGIVIERGSTGDNAIFIWDESADTFVLGTTTATGSSTGNLSVTDGALQAGSLDISGNIDVDGTSNLDVVDIDGAVDMASTLTVGGVVSVTDGSAGSPAITNTGDTNTGILFPAADSLAITTGGTQRTLLNGDGFLDHTGGANDVARFSGANSGAITIRNDTSNQLIMHTGTDDALVLGTGGNNDRLTIDSAGAATFSGTLTSTGKITADAGIDIDNFNIDGTTIALSSGDMVLDSAGDIKLDAAGNDWIFLSGGTAIGRFINSSSDFVLQSDVQDKDIIFKGDDGGSGITALTLDMSAAGKAAFNKGATFGASVTAQTDTDTSNSGSVTLDYAANQNFVLTMTGNVTLANPTTEVVGQSGFITFIQDGTGSRVLSVGSQYFCAGGEVIVLSTAANSIDIVPYVVIAAGKICLGAPQLAFADAS